MGDQLKAVQTNFTAGELDPKLGLSRIDTKQYYNGAHILRNVVCQPQGGVKRRGGLRNLLLLGTDLSFVKFKDFVFSTTQHYMMLLRKAAPASPSAPATAYVTGDRTATITVTSSLATVTYTGSITNLVDGGFTANTTDSLNIAASPDFAHGDYWQFAFAAATYIDEATFYHDRALTIPWGTWKFQWSNDGTNFTDLNTFTWNTQTSIQPVTGCPVTGITYLRVTKFNRADNVTATFFEEVEFKEGTPATPNATRLSIFKGGVFQVDVAISALLESQIPEVTFLQSLDTLLIFHPDVQTQKLVRNGSDVSWSLSNVTYLNIPSDPFSLVTSVTVDPFAATGLNIAFTASGNIFTAGMVGWFIRGNGGVAKIITFTDATHVQADIKKDFLDINPPIPAGEWTLEEPAWSNTRGWPSCGTFHQGRLYLAATRQRPQNVWASRGGGQYFDFNDVRSDLADYGFGVVGDSDTVSAMQNLYSGRYLSAMADDSEWYFPQGQTDPITPSNVLLKRATRRGSLSRAGDGSLLRVPLIEVDGGILFVQKGGKAVREFLWNVDVADYTAQNISLLSPQLLNAPADFALRKATSTDDSDLALVTNGDGSEAVLCTLRDQNITAWTGWSTEGEIKACGVDQEDIYAVVSRTFDGDTAWYLEMIDTDCFLDASTVVTTGFSATVSTPAWLDDVPLKVRVDGANIEDVTPSGGSMTLPVTPTTRLEYGINFPVATFRRFGSKVDETSPTPCVLMMPTAADLPNGPIAARLKRVVNVYAQFIATESAWIKGSSEDQAFECLFRNLDIDTLDTAPPSFTGHYPMEGLKGYDRYGQTLIYQTEPGPFNLASVIREVAI